MPQGLFGQIPDPRGLIGNMGMREDNTPKGFGWLGLMPHANGQYVSELSASSNFDGKKILYPLMVPGLAPEELHYLLNTQAGSQDYFKNMPPNLLGKAQAHAIQRMQAGKSPFRQMHE